MTAHYALFIVFTSLTAQSGLIRACKSGGGPNKEQWEVKPLVSDNKPIDKLEPVSFLPKDHQRLSFPYVKGLVGSPVSDDLTRTKWQENLRESFT